jgi:hypothetical protein
MEQVQELIQHLERSGNKNVGYLNWGLKQILKARPVELNTIVDEIVGLIQGHEQARGALEPEKRDINFYKDLGSLRSDLEDVQRKREKRSQKSSEMSKVASEAEQNLQKAISQSEILIGGKTPEQLVQSKIIVVHPETEFASQYWGNPGEFACDINVIQGSVRWCTSATRSKNYFGEYSAQNVHLYYIIDKRKKPDEPDYKIALSMTPDSETYEIFDAEDWELAPEDAKQILGDQFDRVYDAILKHLEKSEGTKLFRTFEKFFKKAKDPNTPPEILAQLAQHENKNVRAHVAVNPSTPPEALAQLAQDESGHVRYDVARNPSTPAEVLTKLAQDEGELTVDAVAENPSAPPEILAQLAQGKWFTRSVVASNPGTPTEILAQLAQDESASVRDSVAKNPSAPLEILAQLAQDESVSVMYGVAKNPNTPLEILSKLAQSENVLVRKGVAKNPNTSPEILAQLAQDDPSLVHDTAY